LPYRAIARPATAASLAFGWTAFFVWSPLYEGLDGGVLETGATGLALRGAKAGLYALVARQAFRHAPRNAIAGVFALTALVAGAVHRGFWMVHLGGWRTLRACGTLLVGPASAAIAGAVLALIVLQFSREASEEGADSALAAAAMWAAFYLNASMCGLCDGFVVPTLVPVVVVFVALARVEWRRQWLADVADGRKPGWRFMDAADVSGLPCLLSRPGRLRLGSRVVAREFEATLPHREAMRVEPVAVVFRDR
jgi:hypothetical protein